jgi:succinyl-CoA synthetase beta subunit
MNIHEYQSRELFVKFGVPTPPGAVAASAAEAKSVAEQLGGKGLVVKAQVHAGGRGKGTFQNGFKGGVHLADSAEKAAELAEKMIGQVLVTHQTGPEGKPVSKVLVAQSVDIRKEYYLAILVDRGSHRPVIVASAEGGVNIEEVAARNPAAIITTPVHPALGLQLWQARKIARQLGLGSGKLRAFETLLAALYRLFIDCDCSMVEINPLVETADGRIMALDAKFNFDDNALFRHPEIQAMRDIAEEDPREVEASRFNLNYIGLDGNIACMVNGAGLAMATMDIIKLHGGEPANFLDVGGGANEEQVKQAFRILCSDPNVKAILVNIFGGIMKCDIIAQGIINAAREINLTVPLVVRLEGTNVEAGRELLGASGLTLTTATDLTDAARKVVAAAKAA